MKSERILPDNLNLKQKKKKQKTTLIRIITSTNMLGGCSTNKKRRMTLRVGSSVTEDEANSPEGFARSCKELFPDPKTKRCLSG